MAQKLSPSEEFRRTALIRDDDTVPRGRGRHGRVLEWPRGEFITWFEKPSKGMEWDPPHVQWFADGVLNASWECLDKQIELGRGDKIAYHWVGEPVGETRDLTFADLKREVCKLANGLKSIGVERGDRVGLYMGMVPELPIAMLACARIWRAPCRRIRRLLLGVAFRAPCERGRQGSDHAGRGLAQGRQVPPKANADGAVAGVPSLERVVVARRTGGAVAWDDQRDIWWDDLVAGREEELEPVRMGAGDTLFLLHTSGTTAKPKAPQHSTGGYLLHVSVTHKWIFDIHDESVWWCSADIGWVTGDSASSTAPSTTAPRASCTKGIPRIPTGIAAGRSSSATP